LNCWIHDGLTAVASRGLDQLAGFVGGANLLGGLLAKGIPRNLCTEAFADCTVATVPKISPVSILRDGLFFAAKAWIVKIPKKRAALVI
jgi:hypothetical protein